ncbi:antibiotic biosynthesis monooxygenase family protein [Streptomyces sp. NRRL F-5065]|uniref:antibiotic biosynthesis monooxygenase family protein n=1 Tax=Streptomyces sp. NRRL F-5065 TaxID=1463855 RepID=UPI0004BEE9AF|nr:antibiotic biosynthesis monooxygenase [Streptomyces sp. NRRL F-5065]
MTDDGITLIDAWEVPEDRIDESLARWRERVGLIHTAPGFRDARLHRGLHPESRLGLVNVAHWDSVEARDEALAHPAFTASAATAAGYATVHGGWYQVAAAFRTERIDAKVDDASIRSPLGIVPLQPFGTYTGSSKRW